MCNTQASTPLKCSRFTTKNFKPHTAFTWYFNRIISHERKWSIHCNRQFSFSYDIYITIISFTEQKHQTITKYNIVCEITHKLQHGSYWCVRVRVLPTTWESKISLKWRQQSQSFSFHLIDRQAQRKACA